MTDRELLEYAAKAAGYKVRWNEVWKCFVHIEPFNTDNPPTLAGQRLMWVPLTDDGDALRLVVNLKITPHIDGSMTDCEGCTVAHLGDPYAATRIAITRAAAEIGKGMP